MRQMLAHPARRLFAARAARRHVGFAFVPQQEAWVLERLGKFKTVLQPGLRLLLPVLDRVAYVHSLKENVTPLNEARAITRDNVALHLDGVLYWQIVDAVRASYGVTNPALAVAALAQTTMRSEIGKLTLDQVLQERDTLNSAITHIINEASDAWGLTCHRYEIKDVVPNTEVRRSMDLESAAERRKRQVLLEAQGNAESIQLRAEANAESLKVLLEAMDAPGGKDAIRLQLAEDYVRGVEAVGKDGTKLVLPLDLANPKALVGRALGLLDVVDRPKPHAK